MYINKLIDIADNTVKEHKMIDRGDHIIIGVSGGADSVALLLYLYRLKDELELSLTVCHINHCLRGQDSENDEEYVRNLCKSLDIECKVLRFDAAREAKEHHTGVEEYSRNKRYEFFSSCSSLNSKIATAHNLNDSVETVIFNMTRGTSTKGLTGIPYVRDNIIRPLRDCDRALIEDFVTGNGYTYCTDKTNLEDDYSRNKIRLNVIPELSKINTNILNSINRMSSQLSSQYLMVHDIAKNKLNKSFVSILDNILVFDRSLWLDDYDCVTLEIIKILIDYLSIDVSEKKVKLILKIIYEGKGAVQADRAYILKSSPKFIYLEEAKPPIEYFNHEILLPKAHEKIKYKIFNSKFIEILNLGENYEEINKKINNKDLTNCLKCDKMVSRLFIEQVSDNDTIYRQGRQHKLNYLYKLGKKGLSNYEISKMLTLKDEYGRVLWAERFGADQTDSLNEQNLYLLKITEE